MGDLPKVAAVVLAAGSSRRMGEQHKLLSNLAGKPMVSRVINAVLNGAVYSTTVVVGYRGEETRAALKGREVTIVNNPDHSAGLATSLKLGLSSLPADIDGAMIMLADMPFVGAGLVDELIGAFGSTQEQDIIVPVRSGRLGNPVIWPIRFFPEMMELDGDSGARILLKKYAEKITAVPVQSDAAFFDIDTPAELEQAGFRFDSAAREGDS